MRALSLSLSLSVSLNKLLLFIDAAQELYRRFAEWTEHTIDSAIAERAKGILEDIYAGPDRETSNAVAELR